MPTLYSPNIEPRPGVVAPLRNFIEFIGKKPDVNFGKALLSLFGPSTPLRAVSLSNGRFDNITEKPL